MSEHLNDKAAEQAEQFVNCTCKAKDFIGILRPDQIEHALSCPANILYRGKKKIGRLIKKK